MAKELNEYRVRFSAYAYIQSPLGREEFEKTLADGEVEILDANERFLIDAEVEDDEEW